MSACVNRTARWRIVVVMTMLAVWTFTTPVAQAEALHEPVGSFSTAKKIARNDIYEGRARTFYCGCAYTPRSRSGGVIDAASCGYTPRKSETRGKRLEWEHVMPASTFWGDKPCWEVGHELCVRDGSAYRGRGCCARVDEAFRRAETDLHNLVPSVGELNGDRRDMAYGEVALPDEPEPRAYGACDFEVDFSLDLAEPAEALRGDVARIWFYMAETYGVALTFRTIDRLRRWAEADPPSDWERERDQRIEAIQGNANRYVSDPACNGEAGFVRVPCPSP